MLLGSVAWGQAPSSGPGFGAYAIVTTRNIFDPDRVPYTRSQPVGYQRRYTAPAAPPAPDYISLTGVLLDRDKALAFFSGSRGDYDKVVPMSGGIADAKLTKVTTAGVEVNRGGKTIALSIGETLTLNGSTPGVAPTTVTTPATATSAPTATSNAEAPPAPGDATGDSTPLPGNLSDVMRRMMERRQEQLK